FWRRWHITLGEWFKDYVFYPVSMSAVAKKYIAGAGKGIKAAASKANVGSGSQTGDMGAASAGAASVLTKEQKEKIKNIKKRRQKVVLCVSLLAVWICNGLWHGLGINFLVMGLYFGAVVIITTLLEPVSKAFGKKHPKLSVHPLWHFWQQVRTYVLIMVGTTLLNVANVGETIERWGRVFTDLRFTELFGERFWKFGLTPLQWALLAAGLLAMLVVSILETKFNKKITALVMDRKIVVRFIIYWVVLALILLSLNIENAEFIYASF
ncbi:MAG: hypothetical protein HUJ75_04115, partial [Parasporobacterium sp.]|nr:hypothetical protein [Parasporobacterium sp.]